MQAIPYVMMWASAGIFGWMVLQIELAEYVDDLWATWFPPEERKSYLPGFAGYLMLAFSVFGGPLVLCVSLVEYWLGNRQRKHGWKSKKVVRTWTIDL